MFSSSSLIITALTTIIGFSILILGNPIPQFPQFPFPLQYLNAQFTGKGGIYGTVSFLNSPQNPSSQLGTKVLVNIWQGLTNTTSEGYPYHIHELPIGPDGTCASTGPHLDPAGVNKVPLGTKYVCDRTKPEACEEGDLSGKHGTLPGSLWGGAQAYYDDRFLIWDGDASATIKGRSIVIHNPDGKQKNPNENLAK
ncbi:hypothetical protein G9A89_010619 [Geosiphon pyriformis]|nr:hypothetical protein G9A89_010619 [Geosiphon pyriformis]